VLEVVAELEDWILVSRADGGGDYRTGRETENKRGSVAAGGFVGTEGF